MALLLRPSPRMTFLLPVFLFVAASIFFLLRPSAANAEQPVAEKTEASVIRTKKPKATIREAAKKGVEVLDVAALPGDEALITLEGSPSTASVQSLAGTAQSKPLPSFTYRALATPNDTNYADQWNMEKISAPAAWDITTGGSDTTIAVIDTGVLSSQAWGSEGPYTQPDFPSSKIWNNSGETGVTQAGDTCWTGAPVSKAANTCDDDANGFVDDWQGWDFMGGFRGPSALCPNSNDPSTYESSDPNYLNQDNDPQPYSCDSPSDPTALNKTHYDGDCEAFTSACYVGHGTMAASVAVAASNNNQLVAGVDWQAKVMPIRVLDGYGSGTSAQVAAGIEYAAEMGADVINMSLALFDENGSCVITDETVETALEAATAAGVVVVSAAGNTAQEGVCYPARSSHSIAVGASTSNDERAGFSTYGSELDLVAPGANVPVANAPSSANNSNYDESVNGTSFAAPHVAGAASIVTTLFPSMPPDGIAKVLIQNADHVSGMRGAPKSKEFGYGRLNLKTAIDTATTGGYGDIRLISCSGEKYLIERGIARKRAITTVGMTHWGLTDLYFQAEDEGCSYPSYSLPLDRVIRSRSSDNEYFIDSGRAQRIHSRAAADSWGIENYETTEYPKLNGQNIHFLSVASSLSTFSPNITNSNIRLFSCNGQDYLVERGIKQKRELSATARFAWGIDAAYFAPDTVRCDYPSYSLPLERIIRSRDTGKEYLTDTSAAYHIESQRVATAWGLGILNSQSYPQLDGDTVHFLSVRSSLPQLAQSDTTNQVYLIDSGKRHYITESELGDTTPLQLIRGYDEVPKSTFSNSLIAGITAGTDINYSFKISADWYLLNHNQTRKIDASSAARWNFLSGPTLSADILQIFDENYAIGHGWKRDSYYYRVTTDGNVQRTTNSTLAESWGVLDAPQLTRLLTNLIVEEQGVTEQ